MKETVPKYYELMNPLLQALKGLGGSGSNEEIFEKVSELLNLPEEVLSLPHKPEKDSRSEVEYRLAWARTYLKKCGIIDNSSRGVWAITPEGKSVEEVEPKDVIQKVREINSNKKDVNIDIENGTKIDEESEEEELWRSNLHHLLTTELEPDAFERLVKRLLRESGFVQVEVSNRGSDGGIDGTGIMKLGGLLSFHVVFQCKRYQGSVSSPQIRDFRGAMIGRADKGLFVTTGTFTRDAIKEATRDGAPPIELVDGTQLADMLKDLELGVKTRMVESISIDENWFKSI